ncbi:hypothetical protein [Leucobacter sp. NPDC077196]|uniref:hypothetical protein n=1 Tax=Leucobacter sp. NPDC077196 TaxID=3154959 RepID=UPI0034260BEB
MTTYPPLTDTDLNALARMGLPRTSLDVPKENTNMTEMRILTVRQPWAWAIIYGGKDVENRVRNVAGDYRGPVAIHAGAEYDREADAHPEIRSMARARDAASLREHLIAHGEKAYRRIIGVADFTGVHLDRGQESELCSEWAETEVHHLVLENPRPLAEPIPYRGALGLRRLEDTTTAQILAQIGDPR